MTSSGRGERFVLAAKLAYSALEVAVGVALVLAVALHHDLAATVRSMAHHELRSDPTDVVARRALAATKGVRPSREVVVGIAVLVYGAFKAGLLAAALRGARRAVLVGAVVFSALAVVALGVLVRHPTPARVLLGLVDVAVAAVLVRDARRSAGAPLRV